MNPLHGANLLSKAEQPLAEAGRKTKPHLEIGGGLVATVYPKKGRRRSGSAGQLIHGVAHAAFINASFAYAKPRERNRFNGPERGAWYAALAVETALAEVAFHMTAFLQRAGDFHAAVDYAELYASLAGEYCDLRKARRHPALNPDPASGYPAGNALAKAALADDVNGFIYPSVRHRGGTCFAVLWPHAVQSVAQGGVIRLTWSGKPEPEIARR